MPRKVKKKKPLKDIYETKLKVIHAIQTICEDATNVDEEQTKVSYSDILDFMHGNGVEISEETLEKIIYELGKEGKLYNYAQDKSLYMPT